MTDRPVTGSLRRDPTGALATNPVGLAPLAWPRQPTDLAEIRRLGYEGIQVDGDDPATWASALQREGLRAAEVYLAVPGGRHGPSDSAPALIDERLDFAVACGAEVLVVASDGDPEREAIAGRVGDGAALDALGWKRWSTTLAKVERTAAERGVRTAFHPHAGTWIETPAEIDRLLSEVPSMALCLDTGHHLVGGGDPATTIDAYADRLGHIHLKDVDPVVLDALRAGTAGGFGGAVAARLFAPLGTGLLDLAAVVGALARASYRGWLMVEQDTTWEPPAEAAAISRRALEWACRASPGANAAARP